MAARKKSPRAPTRSAKPKTRSAAARSQAVRSQAGRSQAARGARPRTTSAPVARAPRDDRRADRAARGAHEGRGQGGSFAGERGARGRRPQGRGTTDEAGTFAGETCRECGAPYEPRRGARSTERAGDRVEREDGASSRRDARDDEGAGYLGPSERDPGLDDVEHPSGASRRGNRGFEDDEPRRPRAASGDSEDVSQDDDEDGPSERLGGVGPRGR
jgi:hypothetical protein